MCYCFPMELDVRYRGRVATTEDVAFIKMLIEEDPSMSRRALSQKLCRAWNWTQANGQLRDMVCRGFLLQLDRAGYIKLPARKAFSHNSLIHRKKPPKIEIDQTPICASLSQIQPLQFMQVRRTHKEKLFNSLIEHYHYLGYTQPVGEHLKHFVFLGQRPIACFAFCSAPRHIGCRDTFIGWSPDTRKKNLHLMAYNTRFLILPWVHIKCLASHLLSSMARILPRDWQLIYNHPVYFLETFVDTERFQGTCYRAANWIYLGVTTGRGKNDQTKKPNRSIKAVWGYPLRRNFRKLLQHG